MDVKFNTGLMARSAETLATNRGLAALSDIVTPSVPGTVTGFLSSEAEVEVRPAEVARGRDLCASVDYPSVAVIGKLSHLLAQAWPESESLE